MKNSYITDTILHWCENAVTSTTGGIFASVALLVNMPIAFLVPSSSGHAALVMPILAPLADFADVPRSLAVTAYQSASGLINLITPTSAVVMGGLALSRDRLRPLPALRAPVLRDRPDHLHRLHVRRRGALRRSAMAFSVDSEVGKLRKVIVHRPGLEQRRLTPANAEELLFDDVIWVRKAKVEHAAFVQVMRERGVEVFDAEDLLTETLDVAAGKDWILDRSSTSARSASTSPTARREWAAVGERDARSPTS